MSTAPTEPPVESVESLEALAAARQTDRMALEAATLAAVLAVWAEVDPLDLIRDWFGSLGPRVFVLVSLAQELAAEGANAYVTRAYDLLNVPAEISTVIPRTFAGIASDGRDLEGLLAGAPLQALQHVRRGDSPAKAKDAGAQFLHLVVPTQIADAGRAADSVAIAAAVPTRRKQRYGWVRMLNPPSCGRCVVLAGRFYRWSEGFQRHPLCDCIHIPAVEAVEDDLTTNPYQYFKSLTTEQQNDQFGVANAQAIRDGADIAQVVNATSRGGVRTADDGRRYTTIGTTKRGLAGKRAPGVLRPTPWQIYRESGADPNKARTELVRYGYILR